MIHQAIRVPEVRVAPPRGVPARAVLLALVALFALDEALLPAFLGHAGLAAAAGAAAVAMLALVALSERRSADVAIAWTTVGWCLLVAVALLLLGGEGRLFYANVDWQVRDAVLADMARHSWPFAYGGDRVLRAPVGMYLLPALIGGAQRSRDLALLGCNAAMLTLLLALGATLFDGARARRIALVTFLSFSGLDIVGVLIARAAGQPTPLDHLETWLPTLQYSSTVTLAFWVPQHAIAGWFCALVFLMHRRGAASLGAVAAAVPVCALWSPLAIIGAVPFAALAGLRALAARSIRPVDVLAALAAVALALPSLAYLGADAARVGARILPRDPLLLALFLVVEIVPALWMIARLGGARAFGIDALATVVALLVALPFFQVGANADVVMRASIPPLAILAATLAAALGRAGPIPAVTRAAIAVLIAIGSVTGAAEFARAVRLAPSPPPRCSLPAMWNRQTGWIADIATYVARIDAMPRALRPAGAALIDPAPRGACWSRAWAMAR